MNQLTYYFNALTRVRYNAVPTYNCSKENVFNLQLNSVLYRKEKYKKMLNIGDE